MSTLPASDRPRARDPRLLFGALAVPLLVLCWVFRSFVIDDAYIAYRFSKHVAEGHGFTWNVGEPAIEAYTSFLWVILHAPAVALGVDPLVCSRWLGVASALGILWWLAQRTRHLPMGFVFSGCLALAARPAFAVVTMQGLETTTTALLVLILAGITVSLGSSATWKSAFGWHAVAFLAALARPDTLAFSAAALVGVLVGTALRKDAQAIRRIAIASLPFLVLGIAYMAWRVTTFDSIFPNPFLIKSNPESHPNVGTGLTYGTSFLLEMFLPFGLLFVTVIAMRFDLRRLRDVTPLLLGCLAFAATIAAIQPIQGYAWRFLQPILPALLFAGFHAVAPDGRRSTWKSAAVWGTTAVLLTAWNLREFPDLRREQDRQIVSDRIAVGKELAGLPGTLFTGSAGAIPYYSDWRTVDKLGLTSREIARDGLTIELLRELRPDLVTVRSNDQGRYTGQVHFALVNKYLIEAEFVAIAGVRRSTDQIFFYFARPDSPLYEEVTRRILATPGLEFADLKSAMKERRIPIRLESGSIERIPNSAGPARSPK